MDYNFVTNPESCYVDIPNLLYYSHIPTVLAALFIGFFVFFKNRSLASKILFFISFAFTLWSISDIVLFSAHDGRTIMLFWSFINLLEMLVSVSTLYFAYAFLENKDVSFRLKVFFGSLLALFVLLIPTKFNIPSFISSSCEAQQGILNYYFYFLESFFFVWLVIYLIKRIKNSGKGGGRQKAIYFSIGVIAFLISFSGANIISSALTALNINVFSGDNGNWLILQYGLFGMPVFMGFLAYLIIKFKAFNIKLIGTQALVVLLVFLIGALLFYVKEVGGVILILINLALAIGFGYVLVKSVKKEVEQKEALEVANKEITEKKEHLEIANSEISKQKEELAVANVQLKQLDQVKNDFISFASHQLRTPITGIKGFASLLAEGSYGELEPKQKDVAEKIGVATERMSSLVENFLSSAKIDSGGMKYELDKWKIDDICQEVVTTLFPKAKSKNFYLNYEKPEVSLPELLIDGPKVKETISNLIDNAIKYTKEGGVTVRVELAENKQLTTSDKRVVRVTVSDTGIGIPQNELPHLFAKFSRGEDTKRLGATGTGLGLYVGKSIVEAQGGKVWAESDGQDKGSRFIVELPIESPKDILEKAAVKN